MRRHYDSYEPTDNDDLSDARRFGRAVLIVCVAALALIGGVLWLAN